jgi:ribosomal protein S27E
MVCRLRCPSCGDQGWILTEGPPTVTRCLSCGHPLEIRPIANPTSPRATTAIDDLIVAWLSRSPAAPLPESEADARCPSCGLRGLVPFNSPRGDVVCPTCLTIVRRATAPIQQPVQQIVECPNCTRPIEVYESDRGKTIVCSECNYFLGCVLLQERRRFVALPFLNTLFGPAKN